METRNEQQGTHEAERQNAGNRKHIRRRTFEELVAEGYFVKGDSGYSIRDDIFQRMREAYPDPGVEEILREEGIDPRDLGGVRLRGLKSRVKRNSPATYEKLKDHPCISIYDGNQVRLSKEYRARICEIWDETQDMRDIYDDAVRQGFDFDYADKTMFLDVVNNHRKTLGRRAEKQKAKAEADLEAVASNARSISNKGVVLRSKVIARKYADHPFVVSIEVMRLGLHESFFNISKDLEALPVRDILSAFEFDPDDFAGQIKAIGKAIKYWEYTDIWIEDIDREGLAENDQWFRILVRLNAAYNRALEEGYRSLGQEAKQMSRPQLKELCRWIKARPKDPGRKFTIQHILSLVGISNNSFYCYLRLERYGLALQEKDRLDAVYVRQAFEYKGYKKGCRQVSMILRTVIGKPMGVDRVRRIMKLEGMECGVRKVNRGMLGRKGKMQEAIKPNLLRRRFKLFRPNTVRVTDVTYIYYGNISPEDEHVEGNGRGANAGRRKAYGSALMDPVTSRLIAFNVSEANDLDFVMETLELSKSHPCIDGGIFHSDQGILYQADDFQRTIEEMGFDQSMSKRGNCWDNATQESFFGHFKDECDYASCNSIEELRRCVSDYVYYYNNERGVWGNKRMTPIEYEDYLLSLTEAEFDEYLSKESAKYDKMREKAAEKAKKRAETLGA